MACDHALRPGHYADYAAACINCRPLDSNSRLPGANIFTMFSHARLGSRPRRAEDSLSLQVRCCSAVVPAKIGASRVSRMFISAWSRLISSEVRRAAGRKARRPAVGAFGGVRDPRRTALQRDYNQDFKDHREALARRSAWEALPIAVFCWRSEFRAA